MDFLDATTWKFGTVSFDLCHDKGTFDAVCLNPENVEFQQKKYIENLKILLRKGSWFIITSCNWTGDETRKHFSEGIH